jgi:hypothetical protein
MLYYNDQTKVVFGSDQPQDLAVSRAITEDDVPDLIANGAAVDASANYSVPNGQSTSTDSSSDGTQTDSGASVDAPAVQEVDVPAISSGTVVEVSQVGDSTVNTGIQQNGNVLAGQVTGNQLVNSGVTVDAPAVLVENTERDLNPLVPAAGTEGPPASQLAAQAELPEAEELPRESHLMLMESKFAAILAKLRNQERVAVDEMEAVYAHVKAVL